jgi:hypothetical protein
VPARRHRSTCARCERTDGSPPSAVAHPCKSASTCPTPTVRPAAASGENSDGSSHLPMQVRARSDDDRVWMRPRPTTPRGVNRRWGRRAAAAADEDSGIVKRVVAPP